MSEIGGEGLKPQQFKEQKDPQKEQGIKPTETLGAPEKKVPSLRQKMSRMQKLKPRSQSRST